MALMEDVHVAGSFFQVSDKVGVVLHGQYNIKPVLSGLPPPGEPHHSAQ